VGHAPNEILPEITEICRFFAQDLLRCFKIIFCVMIVEEYDLVFHAVLP